MNSVETLLALLYADGNGGGGGSVTVDDALSETSTNPVENRVITAALAGKVNETDMAAYTTAEITNNVTEAYNKVFNTP